MFLQGLAVPKTLKELRWNSIEAFQAAQPQSLGGIRSENQRMSYKHQLHVPSPAKPERNARSSGFIVFFPSPFPDPRQSSWVEQVCLLLLWLPLLLDACVCVRARVCMRACACFLQSDWFVLSSAVVLVNGELNRYIQA